MEKSYTTSNARRGSDTVGASCGAGFFHQPYCPNIKTNKGFENNSGRYILKYLNYSFENH